MKSLVTGGFGFIGSALVRKLLERGDTVTVIDAMTYAANHESLPSHKNLNAHYFDVCDETGVYSVLKNHEPDEIYHLAAESHVDRSITGPRKFFESNLMGTASIAEAFKRYYQDLSMDEKSKKVFVHVSTDEVFGETSQAYPVFTEETPYNPRSPYAASKAGSDHIISAYVTTFGLPMVITNACNNFGPWQNQEKFIPKVIMCGLKGEPVPLYGDGLHVRQWIYVDEHARALMFVADKRKSKIIRQVLIADSGFAVKNVELIKWISTAMGCEISVEFVADRPGHDRQYICSSGFLRSLGYDSAGYFMDFLEQTIDWYKSRI